MNIVPLFVFLVLSQPEDGFEFVKANQQQPHISLHAFPDYHRIRCYVRIQGLAGEKAFGRLR